ncbi:hypothetical protein EZS27_017501 [termite gut metagenome]|uniref:Uncharacterized protein n=1 Tax=termite gut metagenome TaxID=433724 RepID=A0A5J4RLA9_9ZZZZ
MRQLKKCNPEKGNPSIKTKRKMGGWSDQHPIVMMRIDPS